VALEFCIEDTGPGIDPKRLAAVFNAFEQENLCVSRKYGGTGLGLSIASQLSRLMQGRMWVTSELGKGSKFFFNLVCSTASKASSDWPRLSVGSKSSDEEEAPLAAKYRPSLLAPNRGESSITEAGVDLVSDSKWLSALLCSQIAKDGTPVQARESQAAWPVKPMVTVVDFPSLQDPHAFLARAVTAGVHRMIVLVHPGQAHSSAKVTESLRFQPVYLSKPIDMRLLRMYIQNPLQGQKVTSFRLKPNTFLDSIPPQSQAKSQQALPVQKPPGGKPYRLLFVDDNPINRKVGKSMLERLGFPCELVGSGPAAVERRAAQAVDIILMDR
jgi:hypothetical protein